MPDQSLDLSVFLISQPETESRERLLSSIHASLSRLDVEYEVLIAADRAGEGTRPPVEQHGARLISPPGMDYGTLLRSAIQEARGSYIITLDGDQAPPFDFLCDLWNARSDGEIVIGSRYIDGGAANMPAARRTLSRLLNFVFSRGLDLRVRDMSSAFRLYKSSVAKRLLTDSQGYDVLQEILVKALMEGYQIREIPFHYRSTDPAYSRLVEFGWAYLKTFGRLWKLRNSILSADYDARAYDALMPPQRYWQRQRYKIITALVDTNGRQRCLDVGCGSSQIIGALPQGSIALDILRRKLRYARKFGGPVVQGSIFSLPVPDSSFPSAICSQVIEHVPRANVLDELDRVLQPGGFLILGTPDYANWQWLLIEWLYKILLPQAYADEHITHYTYSELVDEFVSKRGYRLEATKYILQGELILGLRKPS
jgi:ubiquinone/menaquinone biosynthesis C-methylase UbiE